MTTKVILDSVETGYRSIEQENANNTTIVDAFQNTLSRDGTSPNQMEAILDMNSNRIINVGAPVLDDDAVRLIDLVGPENLGIFGVWEQGFQLIGSSPLSSEYFGGYVFVRALTIPTNFTESQAYAQTAPTNGSYTVTIAQTGSNTGTVGTFTWANGSHTATFSSSSPVVLQAGDTLTFTGQSTPDGTIANLLWTLVGQVGN